MRPRIFEGERKRSTKIRPRIFEGKRKRRRDWRTSGSQNVWKELGRWRDAKHKSIILRHLIIGVVDRGTIVDSLIEEEMVALAAQLICWTGQFIGHGVFEKRAPALLDNLVQAFLMAPFFVLLEVLRLFFGYELYPGFHAKVQAMVDAEIKAQQDKKQKKSS
ncbi:hypothetical protein Cgig2_006124 [Carnegiea gigantea]|uniref:Uncharacterized protein n=1 Tax=Carnegiea gigantea TaxID=171969 RepID=A0A9Q1L0L4_9CARY|nr:hypothetical protein Cgig2_006124 [Carnegiea gigantea]